MKDHVALMLLKIVNIFWYLLSFASIWYSNMLFQTGTCAAVWSQLK